ncbi:MAG: efflux RND transporter permease subunit, partial [Gammaproteobacteria bacterium]|nr:efflux RND transporter permease subunit [Gammaproteobacteria bacterium]
LVLVGGIFSTLRLKIELLPDIEFPVMTVSTFYPSANPGAVTEEVSIPIENIISGMRGLDRLQTFSSENLSLVIAEFEFGTNMDEAESSLSRSLGSLVFPEGVQEPRLLRLTPDVFPILQLSVVSDRPLNELQELTASKIVPEIRSVPGVFSVEVTGGSEGQVLVAAIPEKLAETGISLAQIAGVLQANNVSIPAGAITADGRTLPVRAAHRFKSIDEIANLIVGTSGGAPGLGAQSSTPSPGDRPKPVFLKDVSEVDLADTARRTLTRTNGKESLGIAVVKEPDANLVDVANDVNSRLEELQGDLGDDVKIATIFDQAPDVESAIGDVTREASYGAVFAVAVIYLFLFSFRSTLVAAVSIPLSILAGLIAMRWLGITLNIMTLGGLAIAVGRVVDDSVVVLENVYRHIQQGEERLKAALDATREVAGAIFVSTLTTIVVFAPLAFIGGIVGAFFAPFAITVSVALVASLLVALTVVPVLGSLFLHRKGPEAERTIWLQRVYAPVLRWSLKHRIYTLLIATFLFLGSFALAPFMGRALFSGGDSKILNLSMELPAGTDSVTTLREAIEVEAEVAALDGDVVTYQTTVGTGETVFRPGGGLGASASNTADMIIRLSADSDTTEVAEILRQRLDNGDGERTITVTEFQGGGPPEGGMELVVSGDAYAEIATASESLVTALADVSGLVNVTSNAAAAKPEITINIDPTKAMASGLTAAQVGISVSSLLVGRTVTQVEFDGKAVDVVLRGRMEDMDSVDEMRDLKIGGVGGVTLGDVADVTVEEGPVQVVRIDGKRAVSISGSIVEENTGAVNAEVNRIVDATELPAGVEVSTGGVFEQINEIFISMGIAMAVAILLVYLVMVASLGSLLNPLVIILSLPLASIGALGALFVTQRELGVPALMGTLMLVGLVVTNAIVLITFVEQLRQGGMSVREALERGGGLRVRPILMTAFTTIFALLPLAVFVPESAGIVGAELATVVIGGLITSTFLTLVVVPVLYSYARGMKRQTE